jgi:drug/metabolite transporter (DMT)-like permease
MGCRQKNLRSDKTKTIVYNRNMSWQLLIAISVLLFSVSTLLQKVFFKNSKLDSITYTFYFQLITAIFVGIFAYLAGSRTTPNFIAQLPNWILVTVLYGTGSILTFKSLELTEASKFTLVFATRAIFTVISSLIFLQESLSLVQFFGAVFVFLGVIFVSYSKRKFNFGKGELYALASALCFGLALTNDSFILSQEKDVFSYLFFAFLFPAFFIVGCKPFVLKKLSQILDKNIFSKLLLLCTIYGLSAIAFFYALKISTNTSQIAVIGLTNIIVTVLLSVIFLKERSNVIQKVFGAIISFAGLLLINL